MWNLNLYSVVIRCLQLCDMGREGLLHRIGYGSNTIDTYLSDINRFSFSCEVLKNQNLFLSLNEKWIRKLKGCCTSWQPKPLISDSLKRNVISILSDICRCYSIVCKYKRTSIICICESRFIKFNNVHLTCVRRLDSSKKQIVRINKMNTK